MGWGQALRAAPGRPVLRCPRHPLPSPGPLPYRRTATTRSPTAPGDHHPRGPGFAAPRLRAPPSRHPAPRPPARPGCVTAAALHPGFRRRALPCPGMFPVRSAPPLSCLSSTLP
ncbi:hypothetical protein GCM10023205_77260 [Yinghuangia aomiensis]|uniref:Uncharacterized protein n=1 Tax=Yinghuangia aomiensis TaxID=676205 RepID=A0ABP9ICJ8_9ACTN